MAKTTVSQSNSLNSWLKQAFIRLIAERTGLKIRENEQEAFEKILSTRTQEIGFSFPEIYYELLESETAESQEEWNNLILEITNTESFFFRDKGQFKLLRNRIFPTLIKDRSDEKILCICSAGCSTGEEPYSIAMLLKNLLPDLENWNVTILGIDVNMMAIEKAKAGIYRPWSFRGVDEDIKQRFFQEHNGMYHISQDIKDMVKFQTGNLLSDSFAKLDFNIEFMDLILCRNVFIYFSDSAIKEVLNKFHNALNPLGYLLVGHAELHSQNLTQFQIKVFEESIAYQRISQEFIHSSPEESFSQNSFSPTRMGSTEGSQQSLGSLFEGNNTKMQKTALNLLRQLPANMRIPKLGNLTAAELILQIEENLKIVD